MYFPIGWPKILALPVTQGAHEVLKVAFDREKCLFAVLESNSLGIWFNNPCVPIVYSARDEKSLDQHGRNCTVDWKPDSSMLVVTTVEGTMFLYTLTTVPAAGTQSAVFTQIDSKVQQLKRDSAELFIKETIPKLTLTLTAEVPLYVPITCISCITNAQMMIATRSSKILRYRWDGHEERDFSLDLQRIPFSINQQVSYAVPIVENKIHVTSMDYSPLVRGFAITLSDGRAAFLTANDLRFDPNQVQGIWAQNIDDASCASINHKYRLIAFGRKNSQAVVYTIDDLTGGLELSHTLLLSAKDYPGAPGPVREMKWTTDGSAMALSWTNGGISLWSTFGATLMCSLGWDYGLNVDLVRNNPLNIMSMDWSTEGYQLFMVRHQYVGREEEGAGQDEVKSLVTSVVVLDFVKSSLTANPCMSSNPHLLLQSDNKLYMNQGNSVRNIRYNSKIFSSLAETEDSTSLMDSPLYSAKPANVFSTNYNICTSSYIDGEVKRVPGDEHAMYHHHHQMLQTGDLELGASLQVTSILSENKNWLVIQIPTSYLASNWPVRYSAMDRRGANVAVAGKYGFALYCTATRRWKLFGNETQEKDFVVTGGLVWWEDFIILACYSMLEERDELRIYPRDQKLDNKFAKIIPVGSPVMLLNLFKDQLVVFTGDGFVTTFAITRHDKETVDLLKLSVYDIRSLCIHPACIVSVALTNLKNETIPRATTTHGQQPSETLVLNVSGRLLMVQKEANGNSEAHLTSTCLASCVECIWLSESHRHHLKESLWLFCGGHGMRVWLPVVPRESNSGHRSHRHTFMSRRIMLSFSLRVYPLAILFEDAIILGVENDTVLYTSDSSSHFSLPFCVPERASQVYLHQILRQLIRKNLGYNAWEIARSCTNLPYFPHSLELLLHEVLEEEATSKEPIPDALLPSVLEFIQEFPVYLQTVVQCARKTEIALWPYLFATAGKPKELFQQCLSLKQLETAASYLIILQNLEPSAISRQFATVLLDTSLEQNKWDLARDLVRFLRAIDPNDVESPRTSFVMGGHQKMAQQSVGPNAEDLSLILGHSSIAARGRSFSTTMNPKAQSPEGPISTSPGQQNAVTGPGGQAVTGAPISVATDSQTETNTQTPGSRKKSVPQSQKEKSTASAEDFFIDVILQRHARRLLQEKRFIDLGYMSASLDFHLVGWLSREKDRAARIEDFVVALKQLHEDLQWPKPDLDLKLSSLPSVSEGTQQDSPSYSLQSLRLETNIETGDSGYTSLPPMLESRPLSFDPKLSQLALKSMNLQNGTSNELQQQQQAQLLRHQSEQHHMSEASEAISSYMAEDDDDVFRNHHVPRMTDTSSMDSSSLVLCGAGESKRSGKKKEIPHRLDVKVRYLLQIFTEANCLEISLLLSVLLMDGGSISRITNAAVRNGSLQICRQLRNGLKDMTRWSFQECLGYRAFFINLQPQIYQLDNFVLQKEAIPFPAPGPSSLGQVNIYGHPGGVAGQRMAMGNNTQAVRRTGSIIDDTDPMVAVNGRLKRADSVRSAAPGTHGSPTKASESGGLLRKSKTELSITTKKNVGAVSGGTSAGSNAAGPMRESMSSPTSMGDLKQVASPNSEQSGCTVM